MKTAIADITLAKLSRPRSFLISHPLSLGPWIVLLTLRPPRGGHKPPCGLTDEPNPQSTTLKRSFADDRSTFAAASLARTRKLFLPLFSLVIPVLKRRLT